MKRGKKERNKREGMEIKKGRRKKRKELTQGKQGR